MTGKTTSLILLLLMPHLSFADLSDPAEESIAPSVYLDYDRREIDADFIKQEVSFVNYVRNRQNADIHLMITRRRTASGGFEYAIKYFGQGAQEGNDYEQNYYADPSASEDAVRRGLVNKIKQGLIPYITDTPMSDFISISYSGDETTPGSRAPEDKWNHWAFRVGLDGDLSLQELDQSYEYRAFLSANRTTEAAKIRIWGFMENQKSIYSIENEDGTLEDYTSTLKRRMLFASYVKSLGEKWSVGIFSNAYMSTYDNARLFLTLGPGVEYNIFPYREYTQHELRIQYRLEYSIRNYEEITLFDKSEENLWRQRLNVLFTFKETWGSMSFLLSGLTYLHDFTKNNLSIDTEMRINIIKGLSIDINASYSRIRDQLSLPKEGASREEILLEIQELATGYDLSLRVGLSFQFGSMYSNIVNPRFDLPRRR